MNKIKKLIIAIINAIKDIIKNEINNFFKNYSDTSTKYFDIYMCITFSCFISGIIWTYLGQSPAYSGSIPNILREVIGQVFITLWITCLAQISTEKTSDIVSNFLFLYFDFSLFYVVCIYWKKTADDSSFRYLDILIALSALGCFSYLLYSIKCFCRIISTSIKKLISKLLPASEQQKSGLLYILESITSIFLAVSSCLGGLWGVITMIKKFLSYIR